MSKPRTETQKSGLEDILRTSCELMAKKGFHATSLRDLSQATGRSLAGLYHYFHGKEELLYLINMNGFTTLKETLLLSLEKADDPLQKLYTMITNHINYFSTHMDSMRVMMWSNHHLPIEKSRAIQKVKREYSGIARKIVLDAHKEVTQEDLSDKELSRKTFLLFGMMNWIFGWYSPSKHGNSQDLIDDIFNTFLNGIAGTESELSNEEKSKIHKIYMKNKKNDLLSSDALNIQNGDRL